MIKAVLFDFDGTLANTNPLIIRSFEETFALMLTDRTLTRAEILDCIGPTLEQTGAIYFPDNPNKFVETYRELNSQYHDEMIELYSGMPEMLEALKKMNLKLAIVSSKRRDFVIRGLEQTQLYHFFDYIVAADDVMNPKPHPEPIEKAMGHYGFTPDECLMVGDNSHDIEGAKNAGVKAIAVGWALKGVDYLKTLNPDYLVMDAAEIVKIVKEIDDNDN